LNLIMNAIEAMPMGGALTVRTQSLVERNQVLLTFSDTGMGISPEILPRIFEPFVTDKDTGTGLGLTITHDIIHRHDGDILAENNSQAGATFKVWLPIWRGG
jgi:signal transduction histidine kinase